MTKLYKIDSNGKVRSWSITSDRDTIQIEHGLLKGTKQVDVEQVVTNQSGRSLKEQICLRIDSRVNKQLDKGYKCTIEEAKNSVGLNASNLLRPMLAQKFRDAKHVDYDNLWLQAKYNGHRCLITKTEQGLIAYSRNGKPVDSIDHILKALGHLEVGTTLDGELYCHGVPLQTLSSWIRRKQADSAHLKYVVYDVMKPFAYANRINWICKNISPSQMSVIDIAPSLNYKPGMSISDMMGEKTAAGYEGLILRQGLAGYEPGKRSSQLLKLKQCMDNEFVVVAIHQSSDGWAILECMVKPGVAFKVSAPGTMENKKHIWDNQESFIGQFVTVEFFEWTLEGRPLHPVAIDFREEE